MAIVWPQIGAFSFVQLEGDLEPDGPTVEEITRPGVDGRAFRHLGSRGEPSVLFGVALVETSSAAQTLIGQYKAAQGSLVSIVQAEQSRANYLILEVGSFERKQIATPVGGVLADGSAVDGTGLHWLVFSRWTVVYGGT